MTACPRKETGEQRQCDSAKRELGPLRNNSYQVSTSCLLVIVTGGYRPVGIRSGDSNTGCQQLSAELGPVVSVRVGSNVKANVFNIFLFRMNLGFYWFPFKAQKEF